MSSETRSGGAGESHALRRTLGVRDLVGLNLVAIVGLRWLTTAAQTGPVSLLLWTAALLIFFLPQGLAVAELSSRLPEEGGIYRWTRRAFGESHGFLCGWCYWSNNLIYFPSLFLYLAGVAAFAGGEAAAGWEENRWWIICFSLAALCIITFLNLIGLRTGKWVHNVGALATWVPVTILVAGGIWLWWRVGSSTSFDAQAMLEGFSVGCLPFWATMCFAFAGLELAPLMAGEVRNPRRSLPVAMLISGVLITFVYVAGTAAILVFLPTTEVNLITGIVEALGEAAEKLGWTGAGRGSAALIALGGLGGAAAWFAGAARLPFVAGIDRYLPPRLGSVHSRWGTPHVALLTQGIVAGVFVVVSLIGSRVEEAYLVLLDAVLIVYFIPYLYLFAALVFLRAREGLRPQIVAVPGGLGGTLLVSVLGLFATSLSIGLALFPGGSVEHPWLFTLKVALGSGGLVLAGLIIFRARRGPADESAAAKGASR